MKLVVLHKSRIHNNFFRITY